MEIIYPSIVEDAYAYYLSDGIEYSKDEVYLYLVEAGIICENGQPTKEAIENGMVREVVEIENMSLNQLFELYPVLSKFSPAIFEMKDGFWEIKKILGRLYQYNLKNFSSNRQKKTN